MGLWYLKNTGFDLTTFTDADHADLTITISRCTATPRAPLPCLATPFNTQGQNALQFDTISSRNKLRMRLLSSTLSRRIISWRISSQKHSQENASNFSSTA
ncbi:hypothetical protein Tco_0857278 [Tanacetum coccineum]|uniref:Uncharacterized protein n=1 Tax=Tanacetum coccineum TaxID=301880 RepID=A0ABQ5B5R6_9ASTR